MQRFVSRARGFLLLGGVLLLLLALPAGLVGKLRGAAVTVLALPGGPGDVELDTLRLENARLKVEIAHLTALLGQVHCDLPSPALPARVVYRNPASWSSTLWINVGKGQGVELDSPVVVGDAIVGVVDSVGVRCSRVRLLSDSALCPAVRVVRDGEFLAKGELRGSGKPLWGEGRNSLQGIGFNCDAADAWGPARDLRTGEPEGGGQGLPLVLAGDELVTTGLDGVFPEGLRAARVTQVAPLREGAYFYELEAAPAAGDLGELSVVLVLKPNSGRAG